jgi:hypothetical protein
MPDMVAIQNSSRRRDQIRHLTAGEHPETVRRLIEILRAEGYDVADITSNPDKPSVPTTQCTSHPVSVPSTECTSHPVPQGCIWNCNKSHKH